MIDRYRAKIDKSSSMIYKRRYKIEHGKCRNTTIQTPIQTRVSRPPKIESIIPFFGGMSSAPFHSGNLGPGHIDIRLRYLSRTIDSVSFASKTFVFVCSDEDKSEVMKLNKEIELIKVSSVPLYLPATSLEYIQRHHDGAPYYYYTESDQVVHFKNLNELLLTCNDNNYVAPHRWEEIRNEQINDPFMEFNGKQYFVNNVSPHNVWGKPPLYEQVGKFVKCNDAGKAYAGAYLCSAFLLLKTKFSRANYLPLEHSSGFDLYNTARALKTLSFSDFFVEHLWFR